MDDKLKYLRLENKKLRGARSELESNLSEEKEMVKYLHGVIKNYQKLLKNPDSSRRIKTSSLKGNSRLKSPRHFAVNKRNMTEEGLEQEAVEEMSSDYAKEKADRAKVFEPSALRGNSYKLVSRENTLEWKNADGSKTIGYARREGNVSKRSDIETKDIQPNISTDIETKFGAEEKDRKTFLRNVHSLSATSSQAENVAEVPSRHVGREDILNEMTKMLDSMISTALLYENSLRQKDKHLKKMERRYEYLASIALGEESEYL